MRNSDHSARTTELFCELITSIVTFIQYCIDNNITIPDLVRAFLDEQTRRENDENEQESEEGSDEDEENDGEMGEEDEEQCDLGEGDSMSVEIQNDNGVAETAEINNTKDIYSDTDFSDFDPDAQP